MGLFCVWKTKPILELFLTSTLASKQFVKPALTFPSCRFVRREKEIAETQFEVAEVETLRYKQQVEHQDRELKELQESLNAEREKVQVELESS